MISIFETTRLRVERGAKQTMKKILIVVNDLKMGGVSTSLLYLINELKKFDVEIDVISLTTKKGAFDSDIQTILLTGLKKYWVLPRDAIRHENNIGGKIIVLIMITLKLLLGGKWISIIKHCSKKLAGYDFAVAYRQSESTMKFVLDMVEAKGKMVFIHGNVDYMPNFSKWSKYLPEFDRVICVAQSLKDELIAKTKLPESKVAVIYNMIDCMKIKQLSNEIIENEIIERLFSNPFSGLTFVTVARLDPIKGIDRIIEVAANLVKRFPMEFRWIVIGGGKLLDDYCHLVKTNGLSEQLYFVGEYKNPFPIINKSDLLILTSRSEGYPLVVLESMLLGVPALVTRYPAASEQIKHGFNGFVVENSTDGIEKKLDEILTNPQQLNNMHENILQEIYSNDIQLRQIESVFELI